MTALEDTAKLIERIDAHLDAWDESLAVQKLLSDAKVAVERLTAERDQARQDYLSEVGHHTVTKRMAEEAEAAVDRLQRLAERAMDALTAAEAQRDTLAEALWWIWANVGGEPEAAEIARAALAGSADTAAEDKQ